MTFEQAVDFTIRHEGEQSSDPTDPGGLTKFGIASRWHPEVSDPNFSRERAVAIYRIEYWDGCRCSDLPDLLRLLIFECAVTQRAVGAVRMLQRSLNVNQDGIAGPETLAAAQRNPADTLLDIAARRALMYAGSPHFSTNGRGWLLRLFDAFRVSLQTPDGDQKAA